MMKSETSTSRSGMPLPRAVRDFVLGLAVFTVLALPGIGLCVGGAKDFLGSTALAHSEVRDGGLIGVVLHASSSPVVAALMTFASMAFAFASLFALNLWLLRHVRHVHAASRRRD